MKKENGFFLIMSKRKVFELFALVILIFIHFSINQVEPLNGFAWIISLIIWFYGLFNVRKSLPLIIFYIFIFSYIVVPYHHYFSYRQISIYTDFQSESLINHVSFLNTTFLAMLSYMLAGLNDVSLSPPQKWCRSNKFVFYISLIPCFISLLFGLSGESIISAGYGSGLSSKSALHEYFIVFSLFCWLFMEKNNLIQRAILLFLIVTYILKTLAYGGRVEVIQIVLLWGFVGHNYFKSYSKEKLLFFSSIFLFGMLSLGVIRGHFPALLLSESPINTFFSIITRPDTNHYILSTSADVYYASMRLIGMKEAGYIDLEFTITSFISFLFNLPLSFSSHKVFANLASLNVDTFPTGGGGFISTYFYIWMGYLGVVGCAFLLGFVIRRFYKNENIFFRIYGLIVLVTFPRWWAYTPINLTKLCIVAIVLYVVYLAMASVFRAKN